MDKKKDRSTASGFAAQEVFNQLDAQGLFEEETGAIPQKTTIENGIAIGIPDHAHAIGDPQPGAFRAAPSMEPTRLDPAPMPVLVQRTDVANTPTELARMPHNTTTTTTTTGSSSSNDPVATPVPDSSGEDLEKAHPVDPHEEQRVKAQRQRSSQRQALGYGVLLLVVVVLAVVIAVLVVTKDGQQVQRSVVLPETNITTAVAKPELLPPEKYLLYLLPEDTQDVILTTPESSQSRAYQWLLDDPQFLNYSDSRLLQRYAMATVGYSTRIWKHRTGWLNHSVGECDWETDKPPRNLVLKSPCNRLEKIQTLWLYDDVKGSLPPELGLLTSVVHMNMINGQLSGVLPSQLGQLTHLEYLELGINQLEGSLPTELGLLHQLHDLRLPNNQLTGPVPSELSELTRLRYFWALGNTLSSSLPSELGLLGELMGLELFDNALTGTLPTELGRLTNLGELTLDSNQLIGPLPSELGNLLHLAILFVHDNHMTGTLPSDLGRLSSMFRFYIYSNKITGTIPSELGLLTRMEIANLHDNRLTGSIPAEFGNWEKLWALFLNFNQATGIAPVEWGDALQLRFDDDWDANRFTGSIPSTLANCTDLHYLWAPNGDLTGTIPTELGLLSGLSHVSLANNSQLEGRFPVELIARQLAGSLVHADVTGTAVVNDTTLL